ncbi:hypothetical protein BB050_03880 [Flavobacterium anhuiense]|uniref:Uncharacterized protein n=2 Tax=Flavobacterium anhuiense TaxID=459526 RepID=A0AAC9D523_9FLAO|nr:hypothetical protein BB050_03880 [Flavobacterium anhuiense]
MNFKPPKMSIVDKDRLQSVLAGIDKKIHRLNSQKIAALFDAMGLSEREDIPKDFLDWESILVVVPSRAVINEVKKFRDSISRISFAVNPHARQIHIYDLNEWKSSTRNKTQFQIREMMKTNFGGVPKKEENRDWTKLFK